MNGGIRILITVSVVFFASLMNSAKASNVMVIDGGFVDYYNSAR